MAEPLEWVWRNDPQGLPDPDHARCIAASGERYVVYGPHLFKLTTHRGVALTLTDARRSAVALSTLRLTYAGIGWAQGLTKRHWNSDAFDGGRHGPAAQRAAGVALLAMVAGVIAEG